MYLAWDEQSSEYVKDTTPNHTVIIFDRPSDARQFGVPVPVVRYRRPRGNKIHMNQNGMTVCNRYSANKTDNIAEVNCSDCLSEIDRRGADYHR